jgi:hypothetical protein
MHVLNGRLLNKILGDRRTGRRVILSLAMLLLLALPLLLWSLLRENDPNDPLQLFKGRLEADHKVFVASISPLLAAPDIDAIADWFESFARAEGRPLLYSRAVLIGPTRIARIACGLDPFSRLTGLEGSSYSDLKLLPPEKNPIQLLTLYRVDEGNPMGRRESEVMFVLSGGIGTSSMLAMQLDMERLRFEYGLDEDDLRSLAPGRN